jgi:hypothetical protein
MAKDSGINWWSKDGYGFYFCLKSPRNRDCRKSVPAPVIYEILKWASREMEKLTFGALEKA